MGRTIEKSSTSGFTTDYINAVYYIWYSMGRPTTAALMPYLNEDQFGQIPKKATVTKWRREQEWDRKADSSDEIVFRQVEKRYIQEKAQMLSKHAEIGRKMQEKGLKFLVEHDITSAHAALRALEIGISIEKESVNLEKLLETVAGMDDAKLMSKVNQLLGDTRMNVQSENEELESGE